MGAMAFGPFETPNGNLLAASSQMGFGEASRRLEWSPPFGGVEWGIEGLKTKKGGRYAEPWVPVQEGRERQLAWLDRGNSAGRRLPAWGFPYRTCGEVYGAETCKELLIEN